MKLRPGDMVKVRSEGEIASTLDKYSTLEGLPFIPEMKQYCGRHFIVRKRVKKLIIEGDGTRRMKNTVILHGTTCDGEAHEGCERTCLLLWKEQWLERVTASARSQPIGARFAIRSDNPESLPVWATCQSTSLFKATKPLPKWDLRQYVWDLTSGTYGLSEYLHLVLARLSRALIRRLTKKSQSAFQGRLRKTPSLSLNLQPGDLVEVKTKEEILATLDSKGRNRGLELVPEMLKYCGGRYRVLKRLDKMINEGTGRMRKITNTVILAEVYCDGKSHGCQRTCYCMWREIWLKKV